MKVLVTVKEIAEPDDAFEIYELDIAKSSLEHYIRWREDYAVEEAVQIQEAREDEGDEVEVVAVTIGPERAEETIRMALAKGADRAIRAWDDALADATHLDVSAKADIIAAIAEQEAPDLILSGVQAADDANGATGVALAERLGFEWAAVVNELDLDTEAGIASVHRELEGGLEEHTDVDLPAVLTIQTGINEPRYASLRGIRQAQRKPIDARSLDEIGLNAGVLESSVERTSMYEPESESDAVVWEGSADETAGELAAFLEKSGVIEG
jgi:electron transfer flavoprotein beta subunit